MDTTAPITLRELDHLRADRIDARLALGPQTNHFSIAVSACPYSPGTENNVHTHG
jgi:hypothetical protein